MRKQSYKGLVILLLAGAPIVMVAASTKLSLWFVLAFTIVGGIAAGLYDARRSR